MKSPIIRLISCLAFSLTGLSAQEGYTNFIRQVQTPSGVQWDVSVTETGARQAGLAVESGGARFELWTVKASPLASFLLDTRFVGTYIPISDVKIISEDPYANIPRTRADRPYRVEITTSGLSSVATAPDAAKSVKLLRHTQSYGVGGTGTNINRSQATLLSQSSISSNGTQVLNYSLSSVPGSDRSKIRGEERYSVYSLADTLSPESQLASKYIQIWPVATGAISGVTEGQTIRSKMPALSVTLTDLYPDSRTYAQVYRGTATLGVEGTLVPGLGVIKNQTIPTDEVLTLDNWDAIFTEDGVWTLELLTSTPFGVDRLAKVTFLLKRSIQINGTVTTME